MLISQPSTAQPLQSANPALQLSAHWPAVHDDVALLGEQTFPQLPQLNMSFMMLTSQPSVAQLLQSA
jgi:hypothetical protein